MCLRCQFRLLFIQLIVTSIFGLGFFVAEGFAETPNQTSNIGDEMLGNDTPVAMVGEEYAIDPCVVEEIANDPIATSSAIKAVTQTSSSENKALLALLMVDYGSYYSKLGFNPGDNLVAANGSVVESPEKFWEFLKNLKPGGKLELDIFSGRDALGRRYRSLQPRKKLIRVISTSDPRRCESHGTASSSAKAAVPSSVNVSLETPQKFEIAASEVDVILANLPVLLSQARAVPFFRNGASVGMRLFAIQSGSLYEKLGLANGDVVRKANGTDIPDPSQALRMFENLKSDSSTKKSTIIVERNGKEIELQWIVH